MVDDGPTPMDSMSGTAVPLARAPKLYCMQYFPAITCVRLSGRTSVNMSDRLPDKRERPTGTIRVETGKRGKQSSCDEEHGNNWKDKPSDGVVFATQAPSVCYRGSWNHQKERPHPAVQSILWKP